ncbi:xylulokinase [Brachyspira sp. SAP_772]|uniref:xylulokinase n=1 Tax=Brachyspira sp. SAP_772 TaxID=2608385 RepID=UPI0012F48E24|nr:xylulokinase [Brachyspira sp. SAP_772]
MDCFIGIDLGTSSVKTLIISQNAEILSISQKDYNFDTPYLNWAEQDVDVWWNATVITIKDALSQLKSKYNNAVIKAISFSGQMHGLVALDSNGDAIRKSIIWCDSRTSNEVNYINEKIGKDNIIKITHSPLATGFQIASLLWIKNNEKNNYDKIYKVILPKDYIRYKLTGIIATDITDAASTCAFDSNENKWSYEIIKKLDIRSDIFPDVYYPREIAGKVSKKASEETGLNESINVMYGGADQAMQAIGNGIIETKTASITIGTGGQIFMPIDKAVYNKNSHTFNFVMPNTWYYLGAALSSGLALKWARNNFCSNEESFFNIDLNAQKIAAGCEGLIFLPYLSGERTPHMNSDASAMFLGLTLKHTKYHILKSIMEGVVYSLKDCFSILTDDMHFECDKLIASGGGSHSKLWLQIQADILDKEIYVSKTKEQAALGAAITAMVGSGVYSGYREAIKELIKHDDKPIIPIKENVKIYSEYYQIFKEAYKVNKHLMSSIRSIG